MDEHPIPDEWRIPDDLWEAIAPLLPEHKNTHRYGGGRPRKSDRVCLEAILFVLRTGCQWKALDATRFCPGSTAHDRFQEWVRAGVFDPVGARPDGLRRLEGDRLGLAEYGRVHDQGAPRGERRAKTPPTGPRRAQSAACWSRPRASRWAWRWRAPTGRT